MRVGRIEYPPHPSPPFSVSMGASQRRKLLDAQEQARKEMKNATGEGYCYWQGRYDMCCILLGQSVKL